MQNQTPPQLFTVFPHLEQVEIELRQALSTRGKSLHLEPGAAIASDGGPCSGLPLVLSGTVRVFKTDPEGRELTLYRIGAGDSCILTASCLLSDQRFPATAVAETSVEAWLLPAELAVTWLDRSSAWRGWLFSLFPRRLAHVIEMVEGIAFGALEDRLAVDLLERSQGNPATVESTHQALADDLGVSREAVSRTLKTFERAGWLTLSRGTILLQDRQALEHCSQRLGKVDKIGKTDQIET